MDNNKILLYQDDDASYHANDPGRDTVDKFFSRMPGFEGVNKALFKSLGLIIENEYSEPSMYGYINGVMYEILSSCNQSPL